METDDTTHTEDTAFRANISEVYLRNKLSAKDTADLVRNAQRSSCRSVGDLAKAGAHGTRPNNFQRDLTRTLLRSSTSPTPYYAEIPVNDRKTRQPTTAWLPFLLVHEMLFSIVKDSGDLIHEMSSFEPGSAFAKAKEGFIKKFGVPADAILLPLGFHGDGVPFQVKNSLECFSWNIVSIMHGNGARMLFTCIEKGDLCGCGCHGRHTIDAILEVIVYCMKALLRGKAPSMRHDKSPWRPEDKERAKRAGMDLGFFAHLVQNRGDWAWFKQLFKFKGWASAQICWRCEANRSDKPFWDVGPDARWRKFRLTTAGLMSQLRALGVELSPLFSCPGFIADYICIDVLHALDLGVTQELLGNVFFEALGIYAVGRTEQLKCGNLSSRCTITTAASARRTGSRTSRLR